MTASEQPGAETASAAPTGHAALDGVVAVARQHAESVDAALRFPAETIGAARAAGLLGALIPVANGGTGQTLRQAAAACHAVARACGSSAMVLAMHLSQAACLAAHRGDTLWLRRCLNRAGREGLLLASVTSEVGVGGNMRQSLCAVEHPAPGRFTLVKRAPAVSYGAHADLLLITARATPGSAANAQVLVVAPAAPGLLDRTGGWDPMGMRGTASEAFTVTASGSSDQILPVPFARIAAETMVPVSHLLWAAVWCGIAADAVLRARGFLRHRMREAGGAVPDGAGRLTRATEQLQAVEARLREALSAHDARGPDNGFAGAAALNMLKTFAAETCLAVAEEALLVCGFAGYAQTGPFSVSRHVRDLHSARLMIHNDRIRDNTARLLLTQAPVLGVA